MLIGSFGKSPPKHQAYLWNEFKRGSYIAIGWNDVCDLQRFANRDEIEREFYNHYTDTLPDQLVNSFMK